MPTTFEAVVLSPGEIVAATESLNRDLSQGKYVVWPVWDEIEYE